MKAYGFVFARGGSKGVPGKNIASLCGKPLIAYALEAGLACGRLEKIVVSTDSQEIADVARQYGAEVPFIRPAELASDNAPEWLSWQHAVNFLKDNGDDFDTFVSLPAPSPLRTAADINACLDAFMAGGCDAVVSCCRASHSPFFNMIMRDENGLAKIVAPLEPPPARRQDAPTVYNLAGAVYICSADYILKNKSFWTGQVKAVVIDQINAIDIDEPFDWELAEIFMSKRRGIK